MSSCRVRVLVPTLDENFPYNETARLYMEYSTYQNPRVLVSLLTREKYLSKSSRVYTKYSGVGVQIFDKKTGFELLKLERILEKPVNMTNIKMGVFG